MKKTFSIVLSLLFILSLTPVTFAVECPAKGLSESDTVYKTRCEAVSGCQIVAGLCTPKTNYDVITSTDTIKTPALKQCSTVGYAMKQTDICSGNKSKCGTDYQCDASLGWCCVATIQQTNTDLNQALQSPFSKMKYVPKIEIPCNTNIAGGTCPKADTPANYIARLYQFGLMIAGLIALGVILYGAVEYTLSAGGVASKEEAKDRILQAIYGILLLLGAYLILYTINPKLVSLSDPEFQPVDLSTLLPPDIFVPENTANNAITESDGTGGITGCALANSNWGQGLLEIQMKSGEVLGTGTNQKNCLKCMDGNVGPDANGACICSEGLVRQPTGSCSAPTSSGVCKTGLIDTSGNCCPTGTSLFFSDDKKLSQCLPACPTGSTYGTTLQKCDKCLTGYGDVDGKCVKGTPSVMCQPSGYVLPNGKCIP